MRNLISPLKSTLAALALYPALLAGASLGLSQPAAEWEKCADENGVCFLYESTRVRYGANGIWAYRDAGPPWLGCNNVRFGDPLRGVRKTCEREVASGRVGWVPCAQEHQLCYFSSGPRQVRYGANGIYAYRTINSGTGCTNRVFGDPLRGVVKSCWVRY